MVEPWWQFWRIWARKSRVPDEGIAEVEVVGDGIHLIRYADRSVGIGDYPREATIRFTEAEANQIEYDLAPVRTPPSRLDPRRARRDWRTYKGHDTLCFGPIRMLEWDAGIVSFVDPRTNRDVCINGDAVVQIRNILRVWNYRGASRHPTEFPTPAPGDGGTQAYGSHFEFKLAEGTLRCSDDSCPCDDTEIPRGKGFLIVTPAAVQWRLDCPSLEQERAKADALGKALRANNLLFITRAPIPILACERAARARGVRLDIAARDAAFLAENERVPFEVTPMVNGLPMPMGSGHEMIFQLLQRRFAPAASSGSAMPSTHVFLSYSRHDLPAVLGVDAFLRNHHCRTWMDIKQIRGDRSWDDTIDSALREAHAVLAFVSRKSKARRGYVYNEWRRAVALSELTGGVPTVIPVLLDDVSVPSVLAGAAAPVRWTDKDAREQLQVALSKATGVRHRPDGKTATELLNLVNHGGHEVPSPTEYLAFRQQLSEALRVSADLRRHGQIDRASGVWAQHQRNPLFSLRRHEIRGVTTTAAMVHAGKIEILMLSLASLSARDEAERRGKLVAIVDLVREIIEVPPWTSIEGGDPGFELTPLEALSVNRHYFAGLTAVGRSTNVFSTPETLSVEGGVESDEAPVSLEFFRERVAGLELLVGGYEDRFEYVFDVESAFDAMPAHLRARARELMTRATAFKTNLVDMDDEDATLEEWDAPGKGGDSPWFAAVPSTKAWNRALMVEPDLVFGEGTRAAKREKTEALRESFGRDVMNATLRTLLGDKELPGLHKIARELLGRSDLAEMLNRTHDHLYMSATEVISSVLPEPPYFVIVTMNLGRKADLLEAMKPRAYKDWMTLLRFLNPYIYDARRRGRHYDAVCHFVLSIYSDTLDPGLAIQSIPPLGGAFPCLYPEEMGPPE